MHCVLLLTSIFRARPSESTDPSCVINVLCGLRTWYIIAQIGIGNVQKTIEFVLRLQVSWLVFRWKPCSCKNGLFLESLKTNDFLLFFLESEEITFSLNIFWRTLSWKDVAKIMINIWHAVAFTWIYINNMQLANGWGDTSMPVWWILIKLWPEGEERTLQFTQRN